MDPAGGQRRGEWTPGLAGDMQGGWGGAWSWGTQGRTSVVPSFPSVLRGQGGRLPSSLGAAGDCSQEGTLQTKQHHGGGGKGGAWEAPPRAGQPRARGWAAQGQASHAATMPHRARPCGPPFQHWPSWSRGVGRAAGNISGGPRSPAPGNRAWALPSSAVAEWKPLEVSELCFSHF